LTWISLEKLKSSLIAHDYDVFVHVQVFYVFFYSALVSSCVLYTGNTS